MKAGRGQRLGATEKAALDRDGYVVRRAVFSPEECDLIASQCEALVTEVQAKKRGEKLTVGSYMFEIDDDALVVKWEPDAPDTVQGLEHFDQLSADLARWSSDARIVDPCRDLIGEDEVTLFTEKLNLKRAREGGTIILHQDFPYWEDFAPAAERIATAMLFLDAATPANGCLEVAPATHKSGKYKQRDDVGGFGALEMDTDAFDMTSLVPLEAGPGDVVFFGPFLVHRSMPNRSAHDRRALLYSYQPAGLPHARELMKAADKRAELIN